MNVEKIIEQCQEAQNKEGLNARVYLTIDRHPSSPYIQVMQLKKRRGPWGDICKVNEDGTTTAEFSAAAVIKFLHGEQNKKYGRKQGEYARKESTEGRRQIHPHITAALVDAIADLATKQKKSQRALVEQALREYVRRNLNECSSDSDSGMAGSAGTGCGESQSGGDSRRQ